MFLLVRWYRRVPAGSALAAVSGWIEPPAVPILFAKLLLFGPNFRGYGMAYPASVCRASSLSTSITNISRETLSNPVAALGFVSG